MSSTNGRWCVIAWGMVYRGEGTAYAYRLPHSYDTRAECLAWLKRIGRADEMAHRIVQCGGVL